MRKQLTFFTIVFCTPLLRGIQTGRSGTITLRGEVVALLRLVHGASPASVNEPKL